MKYEAFHSVVKWSIGNDAQLRDFAAQTDIRTRRLRCISYVGRGRGKVVEQSWPHVRQALIRSV